MVVVPSSHRSVNILNNPFVGIFPYANFNKRYVLVQNGGLPVDMLVIGRCENIHHVPGCIPQICQELVQVVDCPYGPRRRRMCTFNAFSVDHEMVATRKGKGL